MTREIRRALASWLQPGPTATFLALIALGLIVLGAVVTVRTGPWWSRALLVVGALLWPLPDHDLQGPVVLALSYQHGIHLSDLLSVVALAIAVMPARWTSRRRSRPAAR